MTRIKPACAVFAAVGVLCLLGETVACAQAVTVQQPAVERFGAQTTLTVPDRGSALIGSVGRAGSSTTSAGFLTPGSSRSHFTTHSGMRTGVYIHDFEAMDRLLLGTDYKNDGRLTRYKVRKSVQTPFIPEAARFVLPPARLSKRTSNHVSLAYEKLAHRAELRGQTSQALKYYRMSAELGSVHGRKSVDRIETALAERSTNAVAGSNALTDFE